jgi:transcriptional regulator with XRE-family HTH domain
MATPLTETVAAEVRAQLGRKHMTAAELARRVGISAAAMSLRLNSRVPLDVAELEQIGEILGVPPARFLERVS